MTRRRRLSNKRNCTGQPIVGFRGEQRYKFSRCHTHRIPETKERVTKDAETHNIPLEQLLAVINEESTGSAGNRSENTKPEATHNRCRASFREAEIGRIGATWKQTGDKQRGCAAQDRKA